MPRCDPTHLRLLLRLASACALALLVFGFPRLALAALSVPMCGEQAESIAAPPISRAANPTTLSATPCERRTTPVAWGSAPERQQPDLVAPTELIPRVPPVRYDLPPIPAPQRALHAAVRDGARPAHAGGVERPPR